MLHRFHGARPCVSQYDAPDGPYDEGEWRLELVHKGSAGHKCQYICASADTRILGKIRDLAPTLRTRGSGGIKYLFAARTCRHVESSTTPLEKLELSNFFRNSGNSGSQRRNVAL